MHYSTALLATGLAIANAKQTLTDVPAEYGFSDYLQDFQHKHSWSTAELATREALFQDEVARVKEHNAGKSTYKIGLNRFSVMTKEEKRASLGHSKSVRQAHNQAGHRHEVSQRVKCISHSASVYVRMCVISMWRIFALSFHH